MGVGMRAGLVVGVGERGEVSSTSELAARDERKRVGV